MESSRSRPHKTTRADLTGPCRPTFSGPAFAGQVRFKPNFLLLPALPPTWRGPTNFPVAHITGLCPALGTKPLRKEGTPNPGAGICLSDDVLGHPLWGLHTWTEQEEWLRGVVLPRGQIPLFAGSVSLFPYLVQSLLQNPSTVASVGSRPAPRMGFLDEIPFPFDLPVPAKDIVVSYGLCSSPSTRMGPLLEREREQAV